MISCHTVGCLRPQVPLRFQSVGDLVLGADSFFGDAAHPVSTGPETVHLSSGHGATGATAAANTASIGAGVTVLEPGRRCEI